ncbi:MAG: anti-sigma factor [Actinomycetota bacterium]|nr:anti-sigma factor [Rubrobacteraceae bacterium]MBA3701227.1 anti-sigma factor [Rubrobacteraceae bacterium]MDQ3497057.1 anti-sigma factor [Actinomycetota bacterium]
MAEDRFEELLGPYLLGGLTLEEERELERHLEECSGCRNEMDRVRQTHSFLRQLAASEPPPELKARVLAQVRSESPARSGGGRWFWGSAAAALLVVAVVGIALLQVLTGGSSTGVPLTATALAREAGGEVQVEEAGRNFRVDLEVWGMPELKEGEYYEMWYYAEDGGRISCGTFRVGPEGRTSVNLSAPATAGDYPEIEITREPDDGNPEVSGEEVLEGRLRST